MRKPKTGRTADRPAEHPPASLVWNKEKCAAIAAYLFRFIEWSFGLEEAKRIWAEASRKPRERSIKALSDADLALARRYLAEQEKAQEKDEKASTSTLARRVARSMTPEEARTLGINTYATGDDFLRAVTQTVRRVVARYDASTNTHRAAVDAVDPLNVVLNIDKLPPRPE